MQKSKDPIPHRRNGLRVTQRPDSPCLYITGTLRIAGRSMRVRESTGLDLSIPGAWEAADALRLQKEKEIVERIVYRRPPPKPFDHVAEDYLARREYSYTVVKATEELAMAFAGVPVALLERERIEGFYKKRFKTQDPLTRRRHEVVLYAILKLAVKQGLLEAVPYWNRVPQSFTKGGALLKQFQPGEVELMIECAALNVKPIIAVMYATGARVSQTLYLQREHFLLERGRGQVTFPRTKNGNSYRRPLHDFAVDQLHLWLLRRRDRNPAMFLTNHRRPYARNKSGGGQLWQGFRTARDMCAAELERRGYPERARVVGQATPHWLRHNFANTLRQVFGMDARTIAEAGMWEDMALVNRTYIADAPTLVRRQIARLPLGLPLGTPLPEGVDLSEAEGRGVARSRQAGFGEESLV